MTELSGLRSRDLSDYDLLNAEGKVGIREKGAFV